MTPKLEHCYTCAMDKLMAGFKSGVVEGQYISRRCADCFSNYERPRESHAAQYAIDRMREDEARAIEQPYLADGVTPNPSFAHAYPNKAKKVYFTQEQLEDL